MGRVTLNEESQAIWQAQNLEHLRYEYVLEPDDVVIDLGAYRGEWANEIRARYGCCVIAVEPTDSIDDYPCEFIKKAAWTFDGKLKFGGAFYYTSAFENLVREYECFDVNSLLSRFDEITLLKCNTEGSEFHLLKHIIAAELHMRIDNLQIQFHMIEGEPYEEWYNEIAESLSLTHRRTFYYPFCWENWERC